MTTEELIRMIKSGNRAPFLYHFTDTRNIPSIAANGVLSRSEVKRRNLPNVIHGGNDWSFEQDDRRGVSDYVHLCFFENHPMEYIAKSEGRISQSYFIKVLPEVLDTTGIRFCAGVSNAADSYLFGIEEFRERMDTEVLFSRTDWRLPEIQQRLKVAEKYEILIPTAVPKELLRK